MEKNKLLSKNLVIYFLLFLFILVVISPKEIIKEIVERPSIIGAALAQVRVLSTNPPTFDFNLVNQTINQTSAFLLDVNCSDVDLADTVTYYDNFTGFEINRSTGLINRTSFNQSFVGNNTINISCSDDVFNTSQIFVLTILNVNDAPNLSSIGSQIATEGVLFTLDVDATDADNDTLIFNASTTLFTINNETGLINFTPVISQIGNYTINISVFDGQIYDYEVISFKIVRGPFCGDDSCASTEGCSSCPSDCGTCPVVPGVGGGAPAAEAGGGAGEAGEGGGAAEGGAAEATPAAGAPRAYFRCDEKWECSDWSLCSLDNTRTRKCRDINKCDTNKKKPAEIEVCDYVAACNDGIKNGNEDGIDCGGSCEPCLLPNCFDNLQNQDEEGIDCGGICKPCEIKKFAKIPFLELPTLIKIPKNFPWLLILIISILIVLTVTSDQIYVRHITKKDLEEYRKRTRKYRLLRRKIYKFVINTSLITLISSLYIYIFSDNIEKMKEYAWIPAIIILLVPVAVSAFIRQYTYYEYKKIIKEKRLRETHTREILQLIGIENKLLVDIEKKLKDKIYSLALQHKFDNYTALYTEINPIYGILSSLEKNRKNRIYLTTINADILEKILDLIENKTLIKASKEYVEFMSILKILEYIQENINLDTYDKEEELLDEIREISKMHMMTVIKSSNRLVILYNELVDIYEYFVNAHAELEGIDSNISAIERSFTEKIKGIAKKATLLDIIQKDAVFVSVYNSLVELFNHYLKKQELNTRMRDT